MDLNKRLRFAALDQLRGIAMATQVLIEQEVPKRLAKATVIGDALVQIEIRIDDFLDDCLDLVIKGKAHILPRVDSSGGIQRGIAV